MKTTGVEMVTEIFLYLAEENMIKVISIITTFITVFKGGRGGLIFRMQSNLSLKGSQEKNRGFFTYEQIGLQRGF